MQYNILVETNLSKTRKLAWVIMNVSQCDSKTKAWLQFQKFKWSEATALCIILGFLFVYFQGEKNNGFDVLYHNMKYGLDASKEFSDFLRERCVNNF